MKRRRLVIEGIAMTMAFAALAVLVTWPLAAHIGSTAIGKSGTDAAGGIWWLDALQKTGYRITGTTTFESIAYPFGSVWGNGLNVQWLIPSYPTYLLTKAVGEVAAFNLEILAGLTLSGVAMYVLARRLGSAPLVALWAGIAYVLFPWHVMRAVAGHASLVHLECFPLLILTLVLVAERRTWTRIGFVAVATAGCWLTSGMYGVMAAIVVPAAVVIAALVAPRRRAALATAGFTTLSVLMASLAVAAFTLLGGGDSGIGVTREVSALSVYGMRPTELVVPAPLSTITGQLLPGFHTGRSHGSNVEETSLFLGWITLLLAGAWLVVAWRRRRSLGTVDRAVTAGCVSAALVAIAFASPSPVGIGGGRLFTLTPARVLWEAMPAFRVPSRWVVVLFTVVLVMATLGLRSVWERLATPDRRGAGVKALLAVGTAMVVTVLEFHIPAGDLRFATDDPPAEYALLDRAPVGPLVEYPFLEGGSLGASAYLLWQREHERPLVNGASRGSKADLIRRSLVDPTRPGAAATLARLGAAVVITRPSTAREGYGGPSGFRPAVLGPGFERLSTAADGATIWRVTARPASALAYLDAAFKEPEYEDGRVVQRLDGTTGKVIVDADGPIEGVLELTAVAEGPSGQRASIGGRAITARPTGTLVRVPVRLRAGHSTISVRIGGPRQGDASLALTSPRLITRASR